MTGKCFFNLEYAFSECILCNLDTSAPNHICKWLALLLQLSGQGSGIPRQCYGSPKIFLCNSMCKINTHFSLQICVQNYRSLLFTFRYSSVAIAASRKLEGRRAPKSDQVTATIFLFLKPILLFLSATQSLTQ
jgi:hypothetical protein